jgi:hypothetical protein
VRKRPRQWLRYPNSFINTHSWKSCCTLSLDIFLLLNWNPIVMAAEKSGVEVEHTVDVQPTPGSQQTFLKGWRLGVVITSLYLGTFLIALDTNIVGVAIPKISTEFNALQDISWYGSAYLLTITAFQPMLGSFYRFFSVEGTYKGCIVVFESKQYLGVLEKLLTCFSRYHHLRCC